MLTDEQLKSIKKNSICFRKLINLIRLTGDEELIFNGTLLDVNLYFNKVTNIYILAIFEVIVEIPKSK